MTLLEGTVGGYYLSANTQSLFVPVSLRVRYCSNPVAIAKQRLDMSTAQYFDGAAAASTLQNLPPNLSDRFLTSHFANPENQLELPAGLYLHWFVPRALATMRKSPLLKNQMGFPNVPNRWLITRTNLSDNSQAQWVVESDRMSNPEPSAGASPVQTQYPVALPWNKSWMKSAFTAGDPVYQYRRMGQSFPFESWSATPPEGAEYLTHHDPHGLTVMGYGEQSFGSIFSNCQSVFGWTDPDFASGEADPTQSYRYDVLGWYSDSQRDCLRNFFLQSDLSTDSDRFQAMTSEYAWSVPEDQQGQAFPTLSVYHSSVQLVPSQIDEESNPSTLGVNLAIGNTSSEALNAFLAGTLSNDDPSQAELIEDQLEALELAPIFKDQQFDRPGTFRQLRHHRGFKSSSGALVWSIRSQNDPSPDPASAVSITPPIQFAEDLDQLNYLQSEYQEAHQRIKSVRERIFGDWYKYQNTEYTNVNLQWDCAKYQQQLNLYQSGADIDLNSHVPTDQDASEYLAEQVMLFHELAAHAGVFRENPETGIYEALPYRVSEATRMAFCIEQEWLSQLEETAQNSLAVQLDAQYNNVLEAFTEFTQAHPDGAWVLETQPGPRYWQPTEPSLYLTSSDSANPLPSLFTGYPQSAGANCSLYTLAAGGIDENSLASLQSQLQNLVPLANVPTVQKVMRESVLMEWEASIQPVLSTTAENSTDSTGAVSNSYGAGVDYQSDYLNKNFQFSEGAYDLRLVSQPVPNTQALKFTNQQTLTGQSSDHLAVRIAGYLTSVTLLDLKQSYFRNNPDDPNSYSDQGLADWYASGHPSAAPPSGDDIDWDSWMAASYPFQDQNSLFAPTSGASTAEQLTQWYESETAVANPTYVSSNRARDPVDTALRSYSLIPQLQGMSQTLGGFNNALLMREQVVQMPIFDLSKVSRDFTSPPPALTGSCADNDAIHFYRVLSVAEAVGNCNTSAPNSDGYFLPYRSGSLQVTSLTLLDSFGRVTTLTPNQPYLSRSLTYSDNLARGQSADPDFETMAYLPPRLSQPAQMHFRWLSAADDSVEMNSHLSSNPICGWIVPNRVDQSLMIYDQGGNALGSINLSAEWMAAPGANPRLGPGQIPDFHLREFVGSLIVRGQTPERAAYLREYIKDFFTAVNSSLPRIEPQAFAQYRALSVMIGRPLALVRANLGIRLEGGLKDNESYAAFLNTLYGGREASNLDLLPPNPPTTNHYERVLIPVRVGDRNRLSDGVVGYWNDLDLELSCQTFYSPKSDAALLDASSTGKGERFGPPKILPFSDGSTPCNQLNLPAVGDGVDLTLLIDPRCEVNVHCGLLPAKKLTIPSEFYTPSLKNMALTFLATPILTSTSQVQIPLPSQPGYNWSWLTRTNSSTWQTVGLDSNQNQVAGAGQMPVFSTQELTEGWLKLTLNPSNGETVNNEN